MEAIHREITERSSTISRQQSRQILQLIQDAQQEENTGRAGRDTYVYLARLEPHVLREILRIVST